MTTRCKFYFSHYHVPTDTLAVTGQIEACPHIVGQYWTSNTTKYIIPHILHALFTIICCLTAFDLRFARTGYSLPSRLNLGGKLSQTSHIQTTNGTNYSAYTILSVILG